MTPVRLQQLRLIIKSLGLKKAMLEKKIMKLNETIRRMEVNHEKLQAYVRAYNEAGGGNSTPYFFINNAYFMQHMLTVMSREQVELTKINAVKREQLNHYHALVLKHDALTQEFARLAHLHQAYLDEQDESALHDQLPFFMES